MLLIKILYFIVIHILAISAVIGILIFLVEERKKTKPNKKLKIIIDDFYNNRSSWEMKGSVSPRWYLKNGIYIEEDCNVLRIGKFENTGDVEYFRIDDTTRAYFRGAKTEYENSREERLLDVSFKTFKSSERSSKLTQADDLLSKKDAKKINNFGEF